MPSAGSTSNETRTYGAHSSPGDWTSASRSPGPASSTVKVAVAPPSNVTWYALPSHLYVVAACHFKPAGIA